MSWVSLHTHSQYSILDSTISTQALAEKAAEHSMPAVGLTDFCNLFGTVEFFKACKSVGVKPLVGCEMMVAPFSRLGKNKLGNHPVGYPLILIVKNQMGYKNLCKIASIAYLEGFYYTPRVDKEILEEYAEGLICLSGSITSRISQLVIHEKKNELEEEIAWSKKVFKENFYLELQRHKMSDEMIALDKINQESWLYQSYLDRIQQQEKVIEALSIISKKSGIPCVVTNDTRYLQREDWKSHEILMNVQSGEPCEIAQYDSFGTLKTRSLNPKRRVLPTHEHYFKSAKQMEALFADYPEAVSQTLKIAEGCDFEMDFSGRFYPVFMPPSLEGKKVAEPLRLKEAETYLRTLCEEGIETRYTPSCLEMVQKQYLGEDPLEVIKKRLNFELDVICSKGMCDYLLIVHDFIAWAKNQGIPVGPGRGSGAGSIILYLIAVTDIEPLRFNLFFERFINPERMSYPDIDVDICMDRRAEVINYTVNKYGKEKVAQIITFGTMKAKMAIKDIGRVLSVPLTKVNIIAKLVPEDPTMTIKKALEIEKGLKTLIETDEDAKRIIDYVFILEGSIRNTGVHAAGLIICGNPLTDHIPVCNAKDSELCLTQYSMKPVESVGMLKIDFLGLKTLTSIQKTVDAIAKSSDKYIDWINLPLNDQKTFDLLNEGRTFGVFQLESSGMQGLVKQLKIDRFEEILAVVSLYRPGPMGMIPSFINRKYGREKIEVDHPLMEGVIQETYGIMVYQEQVMQIASLLANYTLGEGDVLRRAMGKKDKKEMASQREKFRLGALSNGIEKNKAMEIFDKIEKFASYGFNKSHAAAYGYLSYVTAFLKANYPKEWLAALMTCDRDDLTKVAKHVREAETMDIPVLLPDINEASLEFCATLDGIRFAMSGIKGVGKGVVETIVKERGREGSFQSLWDFLKRVDTKKVGKKVVENLVKAGGFDFTSCNRGSLLKSVEPLFERASAKQKEKAKGVLDFLSMMEEESSDPIAFKEEDILEEKELLSMEKEFLGFYLTGHPMDAYKDLIVQLKCTPLQELETLPDKAVCKTACIIDSVKVKISSKTKKKFAILTISYGLEHIELPIWSDLYEKNQDIFIENQLIFAVLQVDKEGEVMRLRCQAVRLLSELTEKTLENFNAVYRKAKESVKTFSKRRKKTMPNDHKEEEKNKLLLTLDANSVRLSQIVQLKKLFNRFPGAYSARIHFHSENQKVATVLVGEEWGVAWNPQVEEELKMCNFIQSFSFEP